MTSKTEIIRHLSGDEPEEFYLGEKDMGIRERLHALLLLCRQFRLKRWREDSTPRLCQGEALERCVEYG
jgi:hypothetical protein